MSIVRISSGKFRNTKIQTPGEKTHPMGERERIALFNMIAEYLPDAKVLDLYAGSGALGIEALSRGVKEVVFVEKNAKACKVIRDNLRNVGIDGEVCQCNVVNFTTNEKFDVVLADPPYDDFNLDEMKHLSQYLQGDGVLVLSHPDEAPELPGLKLKKTRQYAAAHISVYVKG